MLILKKEIFKASEQLQEFHWIFRKGITYDNIKSQEKPGFHHGGVQIEPPSIFFKVKDYCPLAISFQT